jgi:DNA replication and repair protein RecF
MWIESLWLRNLRVLREFHVDLGPGLNVFVGANAQGKTSILEGVGILSRARSFRSEDTASAIARGADALRANAWAVNGGGRTRLEVEVGARARRLCVDGRPVTAQEYAGRLEVALYSSERLRLIRGSMRARREHLDRGAMALWPAYRRELGEFSRTLSQRNAVLASDGRDLDAWSERLSVLGARVRRRRAAYAERLNEALATGYRPAGETYAVRLAPAVPPQPEEALARGLLEELSARRRDERRAGRTLAGPQRDRVQLLVGEEDVANASSGQARSVLLALTVAALDVYAAERGEAAVALLDDLDSELDEERLAAITAAVVQRGQALVTTAHPAWARGALPGGSRVFRVEQGRIGEGPGHVGSA